MNFENFQIEENQQNLFQLFSLANKNNAENITNDLSEQSFGSFHGDILANLNQTEHFNNNTFDDSIINSNNFEFPISQIMPSPGNFFKSRSGRLGTLEGESQRVFLLIKAIFSNSTKR